MVQRPAWLSKAATVMVAAMIFVACAGPAATPTPGTTAAPTATTGATTGPTATTGQTAAPSATAGPTATTGPTAAPTGTPYPSPVAQPGEASAIANAYPNYGDPIECGTGTWNGLPYTGTLKSITAPDPKTVVFTFCSPDVAFLSKIAFSVFAINDSDWLITHSADGSFLETMNGTGPYKLVQWQRGTEIDYSRFDSYWGEPAATATGVLKWNKESAARLQELQAGTVDGITLVGPNDFATVSGNPELQLKEGAGPNVTYLGMNHDVAPWDNQQVRQAVGLALNRQRIVDNFYPSGSEVATHFTPCSIPFGCTGDDWPDQNVQQAKDLLTQAGFPNGLDTTLSFRANARCYIPQQTETATDIQAQLADVGIRATLDEQDSSTYIQHANNGQLTGLFILGWCMDYPDITNFLDYHFGAGCTAALGACYPEIYEPLQAGGATSDQATREAAYTEANNAIRDLVPMVPLDHGGFANAYLAGVDHAQVSPLSNELLFRMVPPAGRDQIVFMQTGEPGSLYCADETDGEALRACEQSMESLYGFEEDGTAAIPALATSCVSNDDLTVWTCTLRDGVKFHDGATLEAKDVIVSMAAQWDALLDIHKGVTGAFEYWPGLWGGFLNPPAPCGISGQPACAP